MQSWALEVFFNFFNNKKLFFAFFIKLIWLGVGFLNRTGAKIGYYLYKKKCNQNHFLFVKKFKNTEGAQLCCLHAARLTQLSLILSQGEKTFYINAEKSI